MAPTVTELTGRPGRDPLAVPDSLNDTIAHLGDVLGLDPFEVVTRRARMAGLGRRGHISCGGASRLLRSADGWLALSLARPSDVGAVPALLEGRCPPPATEVADDEVWETIAADVAVRRAADVVALGVLLGLPVARVGEVGAPDGPVVGRRQVAETEAPVGDLDGLRVVDCSALWAGPLCARTLEQHGATVTKVDSVGRPDGARFGPREFYESLHAGQTEQVVDLSTPDGQAEFVELLSSADVVIEGSRPRAFRQLGVDAEAILASGRPRVWVSITAHGRSAAPERVGFGDDAAAAGGLVAWDDEGPCFVGDAIADPLTGLAAAAAVQSCLARGGSWLLDAALARTAAFSARAPRN